jgi:hypothetical protein
VHEDAAEGSTAVIQEQVHSGTVSEGGGLLEEFDGLEEELFKP